MTYHVSILFLSVLPSKCALLSQISQASPFLLWCVSLFSQVISLVESLPGEWVWICSCWFIYLPMPQQQHQAFALENKNYYHSIFGVVLAHTYNYEWRYIAFQKLTILFCSILCPCAFWANGNIIFLGVLTCQYSTAQTQHFQVLTKHTLKRNIPPQRVIHKQKSKLSFYLPQLTYILGISLLKLQIQKSVLLEKLIISQAIFLHYLKLNSICICIYVYIRQRLVFKLLVIHRSRKIWVRQSRTSIKRDLQCPSVLKIHSKDHLREEVLLAK